MANGKHDRSYGTVFNQNAGEYDRRRSGYPAELIDRATTVAGLSTGDRVLEIGCGTGKLTTELVERGLQVTAVDPGDKMIEIARQKLDPDAPVQFINARLEDLALEPGSFAAVFCASAIHWIDPEVSWRAIAEALMPSGSLMLLSHFGLEDESSAADNLALRAAADEIAPELWKDLPRQRTLEQTLAGAEIRRANISELWNWLGTYDVARDYAAALFDEAAISLVPIIVEQTGEQLTALLSTLSLWAWLTRDQQQQLADANDAIYRELGRPIRSGTVACMVTAPVSARS